ncbi:sugar transferase [Chryseobacterium wangxinyae]|nr:sugar transferase [Chryseobacterium sp. CY350]MCY0970074.1 sugar transferase [Chryseobacterium sp. CY353]MCY0977116.1 sugar transferase [Chryseobacterium sp. CY350]WBZ97373.1 sugar transferase [Chryseobacterium sp. CY350]
MDYGLSFVAICILLPILLIILIVASADTGFPGIFMQKRIGREGRIFTIYKFQTYHSKNATKSKIGLWLRKTKLDELPQLFNVLKGDMSLVGPRPDIPGYYDRLQGADRKILELKPGLTSDAGIEFRNEEEILNMQENPLKYNDEILFPQKIKMNLMYYHHLSFKKDAQILLRTFSVLNK